jgi:MFS family permease
VTNDSNALKRSTAETVAPIQYPMFRWALLAAACLSFVAFQVASMSYTPLLGQIAVNLGVSLAQAVNLMSCFMLFAAVSFFIAAPICDRFGVATTMTVGAVLCALPAAVTVWVGNSYAAVVAIRVFQGCAVGFSTTGLAPMVLAWFPPRQRGVAMGMAGSCIPLGTFLGAYASSLLFPHVGNWQKTVSLLSVFGWVTLLYCLIVFKMAKAHAHSATVTEDRGEAANVFSAAIRSPFTWVGVAAVFAIYWVLWSAFSLTTSYFAEPSPVGLGLGPLRASQMMGALQVGAFVGPIIGGLLLDKVFAGKTRPALAIAFFLTTIYCTLQFNRICNILPLFLTVLAVSGAGIGMLIPLIQCRINEAYDHRIIGRMNGAWMGIGAFGGAAGLFVNSLAIKHSGNYVPTINIITGAALFGLLLCTLQLKVPQAN